MRRVRRPFRSAARKPTRPELLELLRRLYGPGIPRSLGSVYEGTRFDDAELVLHELGHATQIPGMLPVRVGGVRPSWTAMKQRIDSFPPAEADEHEVRAVAVVIGAARSLGLPLSRYMLVQSGARNSYLLHTEPAKFEREVARAEQMAEVRDAVQQVLDLLDREWTRRHPPV